MVGCDGPITSTQGISMKTTAKILGLALLLATTRALAGDADMDLKALQGTWEGSDDKHSFVLVIAGNKWSMKEKEKAGLHVNGVFKLDAKASPKQIDLKVDEAGDEVKEFVGKTSVGIYEVSGKTLKLCACEPGATDRPKEFAKMDGALYVEFKRVK